MKQDKDRAIESSRATDSDSDLALGRVVMITFFSLVRNDWTAKRESKISGAPTCDDLKRRTTFNAAGASCVIRSMNPGFCSIIPEAWTKRSLRIADELQILVYRSFFAGKLACLAWRVDTRYS